MNPLQILKHRARQIKQETYALYLASKDPRTPWYAKLLIVIIITYAFSPIDLIPDFIPILGCMDDLILIPLGIVLAIKLIPPDVLAESRIKAHTVIVQQGGRLVNRIAAAIIICIWLFLVILAAVLIHRTI